MAESKAMKPPDPEPNNRDMDTQTPPIQYVLLPPPAAPSRKWPMYVLAGLLILIPVVVAIIFNVFHPFFDDELTMMAHGPVSEHLLKIFKEYDIDKDGMFTPFEFQKAFYDIKAGSITNNLNLTDMELESFHDDVKAALAAQKFTKEEEVINVKALLKPMDINTMKKFKEDPGFNDPQGLFHIHGLTSWLHPTIESANFSVSNFSVLLPDSSSTIVTGETWDLIPTVLGGSDDGLHLAHYRYLPPVPTDETETLLLYLLSMLHKRPFLHMRFPPRGAVACLRAVNDDYYDIMFRFHPEFQLNEPPRFPFWFTPASFIGRVVIKKDGSHIEYFDMHLPNHIQLNIDMEWITAERPTEDNITVNDAHGQEVDIGFVDEMRIVSTQPSTTLDKIQPDGLPFDVDSLTWTEEMSVEKAYSVLEKEFYPFKEIPYLPFNKTFEVAKSEEKLIHHILLWGSLDDQSC